MKPSAASSRENEAGKPRSPKTILVGVFGRATDRATAEDHLDELERLVDTAGGKVVARALQERKAPDPATFVGKGKLEELAELGRNVGAGWTVFDDELSPSQVRNLEKALPTRVLDRPGVILQIFAARARSREAMTQVELAQLEYMLPRLTRQWTHLSKQFGGIGTKGPGETQIETDRRVIRHRITALRTKLKEITKERRIQRKGRDQ